jgi:signal transduction histidine kinase
MDQLRPPLPQRLRPAHWAGIDCAVTALMALAYAEIFRETADLRGIPDWASPAVLAVTVLPAAFRRYWPRTALALVVAGGAAATAVSRNPDLPPLAVAFVMYLIPLRFPRRDALRLLAGALLVTAAPLAALASNPGRPVGEMVGLLLGGGLLVTAAWAIGYSVRQQRAYTAGLAEQAERQAREQLAEARRADSEQRLQVARELHDVVAHTMSLIAVQAGVANYVISARPQEAARALSSIEQISRGALREMRGLLTVLRAEGNDAGRRQQDGALVPAPGLADLGSLVERAAEAGVRVDLDVRGERPPLSAGLDLAAYRVIQEAITNVIKHAATDSCQLGVAYAGDALTLEITDSGSSGRGASSCNGNPAAGHGITGMRERVVMYGGQFHAAPVPGRGFRVTAVFPLAGTGA